jgi:hypothetical protein
MKCLCNIWTTPASSTSHLCFTIQGLPHTLVLFNLTCICKPFPDFSHKFGALDQLVNNICGPRMLRQFNFKSWCQGTQKNWSNKITSSFNGCKFELTVGIFMYPLGARWFCINKITLLKPLSPWNNYIQMTEQTVDMLGHTQMAILRIDKQNPNCQLTITSYKLPTFQSKWPNIVFVFQNTRWLICY